MADASSLESLSESELFDVIRTNLLFLSGLVGALGVLSTAFKILHFLQLASQRQPRTLAIGLLLSALYFIASTLLSIDSVPLTILNPSFTLLSRHSLLIAAISLLTGPLLVFTPTRPLRAKTGKYHP